MLKKIWKSKFNIIRGVFNYFLGSKSTKQIAEYRIDICRTNTCGYYDKFGESKEAVLKGKETCGVCGCNIDYLSHDIESECSLREIGKEPLWYAEKL